MQEDLADFDEGSMQMKPVMLHSEQSAITFLKKQACLMGEIKPTAVRQSAEA